MTASCLSLQENVKSLLISTTLPSLSCLLSGEVFLHTNCLKNHCVRTSSPVATSCPNLITCFEPSTFVWQSSILRPEHPFCLSGNVLISFLTEWVSVSVSCAAVFVKNSVKPNSNCCIVTIKRLKASWWMHLVVDRPQDDFNMLLRRHGGSKRNSLLRWCQSRTQGYKVILGMLNWNI